MLVTVSVLDQLSPDLSDEETSTVATMSTPPRSDASDQTAVSTLAPPYVVRPTRSLRYSPFSLNQTDLQPEANFALLSELASHFMYWVKTLNATRKLYCTEEYPLSFDGEEAITIIRTLLSDAYRSSFYRVIARSLLETSPPLFRPTHYSTRSIRKNKFYQSNKEIYTLTLPTDGTNKAALPHGVYYPLTACYSPRCQPGDASCYAPCCPNRIDKHLRAKSGRHSQSMYTDTSNQSLSLTSSHSIESTFSRTWTMTVPREILQSTPEPERLRQEAIYELIYTEEDYISDLRLLDELFGKPLQTAQCLPQERRAAFCEQVFSNYKEVLDGHRQFFQDLREYQALCQSVCGGVLDRIGNIILRHIPALGPLYRRYGPQFTLADFYVKKELRDNILFQNFIREQERQPEAHKLRLRDFLVRPVTRLQRLPLLLSAIVKHTSAHHLDTGDVASAIRLIQGIIKEMDEATDASCKKLRPLQIQDQLQAKPTSGGGGGGNGPDEGSKAIEALDLVNGGHSLVFEGDLIRRTPLMESITIHVFLFDHTLIMSKPKRAPGVTNNMPITDPITDYNGFVLSKLPIPMDLLQLDQSSSPIDLNATMADNAGQNTDACMAPSSPTPNKQLTPDRTPLPAPRTTLYPITLSHLGRNGNQYTLFATSPQDQQKWTEKITETKARWDAVRNKHRVFQMRLLTDYTFGPALTAGSVLESIPFTGKDGLPMVLFSTASGIWIGSPDGTVMIQQVLALVNVVQINILHECSILFVLANGTLTAYALDHLDPRSPVVPPSFQRISSQGVQFFSCGVTSGHPLLITMKRKGMDSHFKAWDPVCGDLRDRKNYKHLHARSSFLSKPTWFKMRTAFYVGAPATSVMLLAARLAIVCERGFEIINLDALHSRVSLPDLEHNAKLAFVQERAAVPLSMFKCGSGFLLCYDSFAIRVDGYGRYDAKAYDRIDWIGTPQKVAFFYPFVLATDPQLIEIRNVDTGELVQLITGKNMQGICTAPRIHCSMAHSHDPSYQFVFELTPADT